MQDRETPTRPSPPVPAPWSSSNSTTAACLLEITAIDNGVSPCLALAWSCAPSSSSRAATRGSGLLAPATCRGVRSLSSKPWTSDPLSIQQANHLQAVEARRPMQRHPTPRIQGHNVRAPVKQPPHYRRVWVDRRDDM